MIYDLTKFPNIYFSKKKAEHNFCSFRFKVFILLIGSESHLSLNIMSSEIWPENYTATCSDCNDGYGGVIVIHKKHLMLRKTILNSLEVVLYLLK